MKKIVGYVLSMILFWIGDLIAKTFKSQANKGARGYRVFNWFMCHSLLIQDWAGNEKPWRNVKNNLQITSKRKK